jgi:hypothetical protein
VTKKKEASGNRAHNELDAASKMNPYSNNSREGGEYYYQYQYYHHHHRHHHPHSHQQQLPQPTPQYLPFNNEKMVMLFSFVS